MERPRTRMAVSASRAIASACGTSACWILWSLLVVTAGFLIAIHFTRVIPVPAFLLHRLEARFAEAQLQPRFGSTRFDPTGTLVLEDVRIHSPMFAEPIASARAIVLNLDVWAVVIGDFDVDAIDIAGLELHCPAMFSPSGMSLPVVRDLHATLVRDGHVWSVPRADFRIGSLVTSLEADWDPRSKSGVRTPIEPKDWVRRYFDAVRTIAGQLERLGALGETRIDGRLSIRNGELARASLEGRTGRLGARGITLEDVRFRGEFESDPRIGPPFVLQVDASRALLANGAELVSPRIRASGNLTLKPLEFIPGPVEIVTQSATWRDATVDGLIFRTSLEALPVVEGELALARHGTLIRAVGSVDPRDGSLTSRIEASLDPTTLTEAVSTAATRTGSPLLKRLGFPGPVHVDTNLQLANGWRFRGAQGRFQALDADILGVVSTVASGRFDATSHGLVATDLLLAGSDLHGTGQYRMDFATRDYRFLIHGRVLPDRIDAWFTDWWPRFWSRFSFAADSPPTLDLEVAGRWGDRRQTVVAGSVETGSMTMHALPFDKVFTRLFIRDHHYDVLEIDASLGERRLKGSFTQSDRPVDDVSRKIEFDLETDLDLPRYARLASPAVLEAVQPFVFEGKPDVKVAGLVEFREQAFSEDLSATVVSSGILRIFEFPVENATFNLRSRHGTLDIRDIRADLASGRLEGTALSDIGGDGRRVQFKATLSNARLDQLSVAYADFRWRSAGTRVQHQDPAEGVLGGKGFLTLKLDAAGLASDLWSFSGNGTAVLTQADLGRIRILGPLSKLFEGTILNFSSFKLTDANTQFALMGDKLAFSKLELTGPSAQMRSFGTYTMPTSGLEFNTTIFPFRETWMPVIGLLGLVLEPFSRVLEVRLTGTLDKPQWTFAGGASVPVHEPMRPRKEIAPINPAPPSP